MICIIALVVLILADQMNSDDDVVPGFILAGLLELLFELLVLSSFLESLVRSSV